MLVNPVALGKSITKCYIFYDQLSVGTIATRIEQNEWVEICHEKKSDFRSTAFEAIHSAAEGLHQVGAISQETMRSFDESCLVPLEELQPKEIKALREQLHLSQPVFARYLNTSLSTIQKWESGAKLPGGPSLKLLSIVQKHGLKILL